MQMHHNIARALSISSCLLASAAALQAQAVDNVLPQELQGVTIDEKLGSNVNLDLEFTAENGYQVPLRKYFGKGKPVILNLVYYRCPMLCNLVLNGQTEAMKQLAWTAGEEFEVVTVSIDPQEGFNLAQAKRKWYLAEYGRPAAAEGWHFLSDYQGNVARLAKQVGFNYKWDPRQEQWAHAAAIMLLTPDGRLSRYLYGVRYKDRDLRLALAEASEGKLGTVGDKLLLFCFHYDPKAKSYVPFAKNLMRAGGAASVVLLGTVLTFLWRRERSKAPEPNGVAQIQ